MKFIFFFSLFCVFYVYFGYFSLLNILVFFFGKKYSYNSSILMNEKNFSVSIIICAYNEEKHIKKRIENLLALEFSKDMLEIIIASDGSTDKTVEIAKEFEPLGVKVVSFDVNRGRGITQNEIMMIAQGEIVVFTDAETEFENGFLKRIVRYFADKRVGCTVGNLIYVGSDTGISQAEGLYWGFEKKIRALESILGILATGSGACMALKRELWKDLTPIDDCDFISPLDVIKSGYRVVYAGDALAYDVPSASIIGEVKARVRQTSRNLVGTVRRWSWRGWIEFPFVTWGLLSHKLLRWFTPFFLLALLASSVFLVGSGLIYEAVLLGQGLLYSVAIMGFVGEVFQKKIPLASTVFTFMVANIGMAIGVFNALTGRIPAIYKKAD
jgi:cellulose synthase/poly-beta-1,6-N-acetylglucosamine synthase-like glycosyltransferase